MHIHEECEHKQKLIGYFTEEKIKKIERGDSDIRYLENCITALKEDLQACTHSDVVS